MSSRIVSSFLLALVCACHEEGSDSPVPAPSSEPRAAPEAARNYSWRPGRVVPDWGDLPAPEIPFGPLGRTASTRLYVTFDGPPEVELTSQGGSWRPKGPVATVPGRFGQGLRLDKTRMRFALGSCGPKGRQWTIEFWLRPDSLGPGPILNLENLVEVRSDDAGFVTARTPGSSKETESMPRPTFVRSPVPLREGEWSLVGIVLDLRDTSSLRVVVDGQATGKRLATPFEPPAELDLVLGDGSGRIRDSEIDELRLQARAANTEEFEDELAPPRPMERLRLSHDGVDEELEMWSSFVRLPRIDSPETWRQGMLERVVADESGLRRVDGNWRRIDACDPPVARTTQASAFLGNHRIVLFGGETRDSHSPPMSNTDDTWIFDTLAETWQRLELPLAPHGRCHQDVAYSPDHDYVLLSGGFEFVDNEPRQFADTWIFRGQEQRWEDCGPATKTRASNDDTVIYHARSKLFLKIAGRSVRIFDPVQRVWTEERQAEVVDERGEPTKARPAGSMIGGYDPRNGLILLFGGVRDHTDDSQYLDDTYLYDFDSNRMTLLDRSGPPSPRVRGGLEWDPRHERFVLFGGVLSQRSERKDDLWSFDPDSHRWTLREAANGPSARGGYYGMEYDPELDRFFLLCGRHSHARFMSEAWTLSLDEAAPGRTLHVFDRSAFPGGVSWFAEPELPGDARIESRFRSSEDALHWGTWASEAQPTGRYLQVELTLWAGSHGEVPRMRAMGFRQVH